MIKSHLKLIFLSISLVFFQIQTISSDDEWVVNDIRITGLQRVSAGSVFNVMPIAVGDTVDVYDLQTTAKTIFKTGQFDDN
jgi:outer membrane protein insertion porin family